MALWGAYDIKSGSGTGTVTVTAANSTVIGASGADLTNFAAGDILNVGDNNYVITAVANATTATVSTVNGATLTGASANGDYVVSEKPIYVGKSESTDTSGDSGDLDKIYGVNDAEVAAEAAAGTPVPHSGWVRRTTGTGGRSGRTFMEVLVAGGISGDAEDTVMQDYYINITTQPSDSSETSGDPASFAVVAATVPTGGTISYQWQVDTGSGFGNVSNGATGGGGTYSGATTATLSIDDNSGLDGYDYRCQLSVTGGTTQTTDTASLTEA